MALTLAAIALLIALCALRLAVKVFCGIVSAGAELLRIYNHNKSVTHFHNSERKNLK